MDGFTVKEVVVDLKKEIKSIREENDIALKTQEKILGTLENINDHLTQLNSKTAKNIQDIESMKTDHTRFKTVVSTVGTIAGFMWAGVTFIFK